MMCQGNCTGMGQSCEYAFILMEEAILEVLSGLQVHHPSRGLEVN